MCKIIKFRYTKCKRPADAGDDYDEHAPENVCDGGIEDLKLPCFVEVCDKHEDGIPQYRFPFIGFVNETQKCKPLVEFRYLPTYCASHREDMYQHDVPVPADDNHIHTEPEQLLEDFVWHIPRVLWRDQGFRMVDWNPEPRKVPLDHPNGSPKTKFTFNPEDGGVINAFYDAEHWISADGRPIDLLENHYDDPDINDRPAGPRIRRPAMPPPESPPPQDDQNPGLQSTQPGLQPTKSQEPSLVDVPQGQSQYNHSQQAQNSIDVTQPAAPLSGNLFGTWREASKTRLFGADSSSSDSSTSSSSPGRAKMAQSFMNDLKKRKRGDQLGGSSSTKPCSVPTAQTPVQSAERRSSGLEGLASFKENVSDLRSGRLRKLLLEHVPRLDTDVPGRFSDVSRDGQHGDLEQTSVEMSPNEVNQAWEISINAYENGEREFSTFNYPRQPALYIRLLVRSDSRDLTNPPIQASLGSESTRISPDHQSESLPMSQSSTEVDQDQAGSAANQPQSPGDNAVPQGQEIPDDDDEEEQKTPKRRKLNTRRAAAPVVNAHHMQLRPRAYRVPPTPTPTPASAQPNAPVARTAASGRAGTTAGAGTRGRITKTKGKAKSAAATKSKARQGTKTPKKKKAATQRPAQRQPRGRAVPKRKTPASSTVQPTSGPGPMTRARRAAQGAQLHAGLAQAGDRFTAVLTPGSLFGRAVWLTEQWWEAGW